MSRWIKDLPKGLAAGALALLVSMVLRSFAGAVFIPELAALAFFSAVPGEIESQAVANLGVLAKYSAFLGAIVITHLVYGLLGVVLRIKPPFAGGKYALRSLSFSLVSYALFASIALVLTFSTEILTQPTSLLDIALAMLLPHIVYGFTLGISMQRPPTGEPQLLEPVKPSAVNFRRRVFIRNGAAAAAASVILIVGLRALFEEPKQASFDESDQAALGLSPPSAASTSTGPFGSPVLKQLVSSEVTPNDQFYKVQVNILDPTIDVDNWRLKIRGSVKNPLQFSYEEIIRLPSVEQYTTLECISNEIAGELIGNAKWKGIALRNLLERAEVNRNDAVYVVFKCYDQYSVGIPLRKALADGSTLAYEMNGETLAVGHGFPLRAIVPGIYGMMNAKWITEIEVVDTIYEGFWQKRGWSNDATIQTTSVVKYPPPQRLVNGATPIAGIAFAGDRGILKVEVSTDEGKTWTEATLKNPLSNHTWVLWAAEWIPRENGTHKIIVRATDKSGKVQTAEVRDPFPNGATGYHIIDVNVRVN